MTADYPSLLGSLLPSDLANDEAQRRLEHLQVILPVVLLMEEPLSPATIEDLLDIPTGTAVQLLTPLQPVITFPNDPNQPISAVNPSFKRFLTDPKLCTDSRFVVTKSGGQGLLAHACLARTNAALKTNICGIPEGKLKSEMADLQTRLEEAVSPGLRYSCLHLSNHLSKSPGDRNLIELLDYFSQHKLLEWLEVLGLLGKSDIAISAVPALKSWYLRLDHITPLTPRLLQDALRLVLRFHEIINTSPGEIYKTVLALIPDCVLRATYITSSSPWVLRGRETTWTSTICSYHDQSLVAHARNAPYLASKQWGWKKCKVTVRNSTNQTLIDTSTIADESKTRRRSSKNLNCNELVISDDGRLVAAGMHGDGTISIWEVTNGEKSELYIPNIEGVASMAFSPDGSQFYALVFPKHPWEVKLEDKIRVWNTRTLSQFKAFYCKPDTVAFALSPDGRTLITSAEKYFEVFDAENTKRIRVFGFGDHLRRGSRSVMAFLPDNVRFAAAVSTREYQATMEIYDSAHGTLLYILQDVQYDARVAVSTTGLLACSEDGVHIVDTNVLPLGACSWTIPAASAASFPSAASYAFKDDGVTLVIGEHGLVRLIDVLGARKSLDARPAEPEMDGTEWDGEVYVSTPEADGSTYRVEWRVADHTLLVRSPYFHYELPINEPGLREKRSVQDLIVSPNQEHVAFTVRKEGGIYARIYDAQSRSCMPLQGDPQTTWDQAPHYRCMKRLDAMPRNHREDNNITLDNPSLLRFTDDGQIVYMNRHTNVLKWNVTGGRFESEETIKETMICAATFNKESNRLLVIGIHCPGGWDRHLSYGEGRGPDGMHGEALLTLFEYPSMKELPIYLQDATFGQFDPITGEPRFIIWNEWMELVTEHSRRRLLWIPPEWRNIYHRARAAHGRWDGSILTMYLKSQTLIFDVDAIQRDRYGS